VVRGAATPTTTRAAGVAAHAPRPLSSSSAIGRRRPRRRRRRDLLPRSSKRSPLLARPRGTSTST
jgi:hypothetical protein